MHKLEAEMWVQSVLDLKARGLRSAMLMFDESAMAVAEAHGIQAFSAFQLLDRTAGHDMPQTERPAWLREFGIVNPRFLFIHERLGYGRVDEATMMRKSLHLLQVMDEFFRDNPTGCVVQETGGFAACNAVYYAARRHGVEHVFYEPAPFAKRVVFTLNDTYARIPAFPGGIPAEAVAGGRRERRAYLDRPAYVVPVKDSHSFRDMTLGRMFNAYNASRLASKLYRKYVSGQREEFDEIGFVVRKNFRKLARRRALSELYTDTDGSHSEKYFYYPFHVPHDLQLSVRSKLFYNQEGFIDYLCRILPEGYQLFVKEHPASIGGHSSVVLKRLLRAHQNLRLIHPGQGSFQLVRNAVCVITVNSKVGFEAVMQGKNVVVVGEAFYKGEGVTIDVDNVNELEKRLPEVLEATPPEDAAIDRFLGRVYAWTYPCELFDLSAENQSIASQSLNGFLSENGIDLGGATPARSSHAARP